MTSTPAPEGLAAGATCTPSVSLVGTAAERIAAAAVGLADRTGVLEATLVTRGADPLWDGVRARLQAFGFSVTHRALADDDQEWDPPQEVAGVLIHHDPFHATAVAPGSSNVIRDLMAAGMRIVFIDFPHGLQNARLRDAIRGVYLKALGEEFAVMQSRAERLLTALDRAKALEIVDTETDSPVLRAEKPWQVRSDWTSARLDHPILQLPFGEVWLACTPAWADAEFCIGGAPPVEIGIGLNAQAPWIEQTALAEKALGAAHLGYGDNELLGGDVRAEWHADRMLPLRLRLWTEGEDGRRTSLDSLLA